MASSSACPSDRSRITTGTSCSPAVWAARQRRSPATISYDPVSPTGRTRMGCNTPFSRIEAVSSASASSSKRWRGW